MSKVAAVLVGVMFLASSAFAAPKKAPTKDDFADLFGTGKPAAAAPAKAAAKPAAKPVAKAAPKKAAPAKAAPKKAQLVASAAPVPTPTPAVAETGLVLSDYAPERHALAGP